jgi:hypothetical protein
MDLEGMRKLSESRMEGQAMLHLKAFKKKQYQDASPSCGEEGSLMYLKCLYI